MSIKNLAIILLSLTCAFLLFDDLSLRAEKRLVTQELHRYEMQSRHGEKRGEIRASDLGPTEKKQHPEEKSEDARSSSITTSETMQKAEQTEVRSATGYSDECNTACQMRAKALAEQILDERQAKLQAHRDERIRERITTFADEREWEETFTEMVMEIVFNARDERRALKEEFRADEIPPEERRSQMMALRREFEEKLNQTLPANDIDGFIELMKPPHLRRP